MDLEIFEETVKKLNKKKYHIGRSLAWDENGDFYLEKWDIFRKDMSIEDYFDPKNLAVLSSERGHTLEDIEKLILQEESNDNL